MIALLKSDRFGMEISVTGFCSLTLSQLKSDRFGMEIV